VDLRAFLELAKIEAINSVLSPTEASVWRSLCRSYSKRFLTPLAAVEEMCPEKVVQAIFEDNLADFDADKDLAAIREQLLRIEDPNYDKSAEEDLDNFAALIEKKEAERLKSGKPITKSKTPAMPTLDNKSEDKPRQGGFVDFSALERLEEKGDL